MHEVPSCSHIGRQVPPSSVGFSPRESWGWPLEGWELPRSAKGWARAFRLTCAGPGRPRLPGMQQALQWLAGKAPLSPPTRPHRFTPPSCSGHSATHLPARQHTQSLAGLTLFSTDSACDFSEAFDTRHPSAYRAPCDWDCVKQTGQPGLPERPADRTCWSGDR